MGLIQMIFIEEDMRVAQQCVVEIVVMVSQLLSWYFAQKSINIIGLSKIICTRPVQLLASVKKLCTQPYSSFCSQSTTSAIICPI